uniref:Uncharacterized protein n=1 Tax=uncultured bacterium contig00017 TaxID=1181508 RepID=A0A806JXY6_9BACT|nr:hypothetical protein [uncultured bacterium contig00017]
MAVIDRQSHTCIISKTAKKGRKSKNFPKTIIYTLDNLRSGALYFC